MAAKYVKVIIPDRGIAIYASPKKMAPALKALNEMEVFSGVKILDLIETAYKQGKKDGAGDAIHEIEKTMKKIPHKNPGRPKKSSHK